MLDASTGEEREIAQQLTFVVNDVVGSPLQPYVLSAVSLVPEVYFLSQNYPNPFNPVTKLDFGIPEDAEVFMEVYNLQGRLVETLAKGHMTAGYHSVTWNADNHSSGVYFVMMNAGASHKTQKVMLVK